MFPQTSRTLLGACPGSVLNAVSTHCPRVAADAGRVDYMECGAENVLGRACCESHNLLGATPGCGGRTQERCDKPGRRDANGTGAQESAGVRG